jgi:tRNA-splicing ligase RtcB
VTTTPVVYASESLDPDVRAFIDRVARANDVARVAVMPDVHLAGRACVGTAIATRTRLVPELLGADLGCGVAALDLGRTDASAIARDALARVLDALSRAIPTRFDPDAQLPASIEMPLSSTKLTRTLQRDARIELGTLGGGNHFLELQADEEDRLWLMVHTGSRALGPAIQFHHAPGARERIAGLAAIEADSDAGRAYLADHDHAIAFARENRRRIAVRAAEVIASELGASPDFASWCECHHDVVRRETHDGEALWVHRKGAVPAAEGDVVLVPGSMGTFSVHAIGCGEPRSLSTSAHGAGRALTRVEARRRVDRGALAREMGEVVYDRTLATRLVDEAPSAYKSLDAVLRDQRKLVRVTRRLRPLLVVKGG